LAAVCWLTFAFIITAAYAGNLRAYLMTPDEELPIETMQEIFDSGFTWDMFEFGGITSIVESNPNDEMLQRFWKEKEKASFEIYIYERVKNIF